MCFALCIDTDNDDVLTLSYMDIFDMYASYESQTLKVSDGSLLETYRSVTLAQYMTAMYRIFWSCVQF